MFFQPLGPNKPGQSFKPFIPFWQVCIKILFRKINSCPFVGGLDSLELKSSQSWELEVSSSQNPLTLELCHSGGAGKMPWFNHLVLLAVGLGELVF